MQRQPVLDLQVEGAGVLLEALLNLRIDLPVLVGIGPIELSLE